MEITALKDLFKRAGSRQEGSRRSDDGSRARGDGGHEQDAAVDGAVPVVAALNAVRVGRPLGHRASKGQRRGQKVVSR